jgi:hypothetical protein
MYASSASALVALAVPALIAVSVQVSARQAARELSAEARDIGFSYDDLPVRDRWLVRRFLARLSATRAPATLGRRVLAMTADRFRKSRDRIAHK